MMTHVRWPLILTGNGPIYQYWQTRFSPHILCLILLFLFNLPIPIRFNLIVLPFYISFYWTIQLYLCYYLQGFIIYLGRESVSPTCTYWKAGSSSLHVEVSLGKILNPKLQPLEYKCVWILGRKHLAVVLRMSEWDIISFPMPVAAICCVHWLHKRLK